MELVKSKVTLLTECGLFCSAFDGFIVFGEVQNNAFIENKFFLFYKREYYLFFVFLFQIAKVVSGNSSDTQSIIVEKDNRKYLWLIIQDNNEETCQIVLQSEAGNHTFKTVFNLSEIQHFTLTITRLILPSLNLTFAQSEILEMASESSVKTIERLKNLVDRKAFLNKLNVSHTDNSIESYSILLLHYRDLIMLIHKLKTISSSDEEELNKILVA